MPRDASAHEHRLRSHADRGPDEFVFSAATGAASPDAFRAADLLLLEHVDPVADADLLVPAANYGVVGTVLGALSPSGRTLLAETSARAARLCERNLAANDVAGDVALASTLSEATGDSRFDVVAYAPRDYDPVDAVNQHLADALAALRPGPNSTSPPTPRKAGSGTGRRSRTSRGRRPGRQARGRSPVPRGAARGTAGRRVRRLRRVQRLGRWRRVHLRNVPGRVLRRPRRPRDATARRDDGSPTPRTPCSTSAVATDRSAWSPRTGMRDVVHRRQRGSDGLHAAHTRRERPRRPRGDGRLRRRSAGRHVRPRGVEPADTSGRASSTTCSTGRATSSVRAGSFSPSTTRPSNSPDRAFSRVETVATGEEHVVVRAQH